MKFGITLWKTHPLKPKFLADVLLCPVQRALHGESVKTLIKNFSNLIVTFKEWPYLQTIEATSTTFKEPEILSGARNDVRPKSELNSTCRTVVDTDIEINYGIGN